jgi:hypothetical protein
MAPEALAWRLVLLPFRLFVGGPLGSGRQRFTWLHLDDADPERLGRSCGALPGHDHAGEERIARRRVFVHHARWPVAIHVNPGRVHENAGTVLLG